MNPEEQLDRALDRQLSGFTNDIDDQEITAQLRAGEVITQLNDIPIPQGFADRLEARLLARVDDVQSRRRNITLPFSIAQRPVRLARSWAFVALTLVVIISATLGVSNAAASSLPGDLLYQVKQLQQQVTLSQADTPSRKAQVAIEQLRGALNDLTTIVAQGRGDDAISSGLATVVDRTHSGQAAVNAIPAGGAHDEAALSLAQALDQEKVALYHLIGHVDWKIALALSGQLGVLGEPIPTITAVTKTSSNGTVTLVISGTNFRAGAQIAINGTIITNAITALQPGQITAQIASSHWSGGTRKVGVVNADGTVTQFTVNGEDESGDDHGGTSTPATTQTPESGDDHGGQGTVTPEPGDDHGGGSSGG